MADGDGLSIRGATVLSMASLAMTAITAFAPSIIDLKDSNSKVDKKVAEDLMIGEVIAGGYILLASAVASYTSGNWDIFIIAVGSLGVLYLAFNWVFERL